MLKNDVHLAFKELGWRIGKDEGRDHYAIYGLGKTLVQVILRLEPRREGKRLLCYFSMSPSDFISAVAEISSRKWEHVPFITGQEDLRQTDFTFEDIRVLSNRLIEWSRQQDIESSMKRLRELPADSKGTEPLYHLAALALAGDVDKLDYYQRSFEAGDRLGFVPYISKEMIDRAVEIAKDTSSRISTE